MPYLISIKAAILFFPALAFIITLPYMIFNYRKYGSINKLRTLILYSFVLYLITIYFLVILPLPHPDSVHTNRTEMLLLTPFSFITNFIKNTPLILSDTTTWLPALKHSTFYVPAFNVLMLIPFGIYLRYYFKCNFKKTILLTALLSLFFELTQLSGLYFIYKGPYRFCDIDDIIQNTTGGCIGYFLGWFAMRILPSREEIDRKSLSAGEKVSSIRISLSLVIDTVIITFMHAILMLPFPFWVSLVIYFSLIPLMNGKTLGSALLKFNLVFEEKKCLRTVLRGIMLVAYFHFIPSGMLDIMNELNYDGIDSLLAFCLFCFAFLGLALFMIITFATVLLNKRFLFDRLSGANYQSTIKKSEKTSRNVPIVHSTYAIIKHMKVLSTNSRALPLKNLEHHLPIVLSTKLFVLFSFLTLSFMIFQLFSPIVSSNAETENTAKVSAPAGTISLATEDNVTINITPTPTQKIYSKTTALKITNSCKKGATITLSTNKSHNNLERQGADSLVKTIASVSGGGYFN